MSLFADLPSAKNDSSASSDSVVSSYRKRSLLAPPPSILRNKKVKHEGSASGASAATKAESRPLGPPPSAHSIFSAFGDIEDEYDPARPNDYEKAKQDRENRLLEAEREAKRQAELREAEARSQQGDGPNLPVGLDGSGGLGMTGGLGSAGAPGGSDADGQGGAGGGMTVAMKLMKSMGWSEGEGLGKDRQGMATPIILQKTDKRAGVIVNAEPVNKPRGVVLQGKPSKVVLLRNMIAPGEVDESLEDEVAEELTKFGTVVRVLIFEVTEANFPPDQAVRIFVEMDRVESATKAIISLQGRFFGGKMIGAVYFDEDRFARRDLAPQSDE